MAFAKVIGYSSRSMMWELMHGIKRPSPEKAVAIERATNGLIPFMTWFDTAPSKSRRTIPQAKCAYNSNKNIKDNKKARPHATRKPGRI